MQVLCTQMEFLQPSLPWDSKKVLKCLQTKKQYQWILRKTFDMTLCLCTIQLITSIWHLRQLWLYEDSLKPYPYNRKCLLTWFAEKSEKTLENRMKRCQTCSTQYKTDLKGVVGGSNDPQIFFHRYLPWKLKTDTLCISRCSIAQMMIPSYPSNHHRRWIKIQSR